METVSVKSDVSMTFEEAAVLPNGNVISLVKTRLATAMKDEDGDLLVEKVELRLEHRAKATGLNGVGRQLWKGGLFLADYVMASKGEMEAADLVVDLGTGVGLTAIVAGLAGAKKVYATDADETCLEIAKRNIHRNREFFKGDVIISTKLLDLKAEGGITSQQPKFDAKTVVFLGGDIIYDAGLTEAILALIKATRKATFIFGVEKRFVFAVKELDVVAVHYKRFVEGLAEFGDAIKYREIGPEQIEKSYFSYERNEDLVIVKIVT